MPTNGIVTTIDNNKMKSIYSVFWFDQNNRKTCRKLIDFFVYKEIKKNRIIFFLNGFDMASNWIIEIFLHFNFRDKRIYRKYFKALKWTCKSWNLMRANQMKNKNRFRQPADSIVRDFFCDIIIICCSYSFHLTQFFWSHLLPYNDDWI